MVPSPRWPLPLAPQQVAVPKASSAQVWLPPATMAATLVRGVLGLAMTATGTSRSELVPSPSAPVLLPAPQHRAVPSASTAQVWAPPAVIATALLTPLAVTGVG